MPIQKNKHYITHSGRPAHINYTDGMGPFPVCFDYLEHGRWVKGILATRLGKHRLTDDNHELDLIEVSAPIRSGELTL